MQSQREMRLVGRGSQTPGIEVESVAQMDVADQRGSYRPPVLLASAQGDAASAAPAFRMGLRAKPAGEVDVDAALRDLGVDVEERESVEGQELTDFLGRCLEGPPQPQLLSPTVALHGAHPG